MKLYTENDLKKAILFSLAEDSTMDKILGLLNPIEIPSNEDIEKKLESLKGWILIEKDFFEKGAYWMKQNLLEQIK